MLGVCVRSKCAKKLNFDLLTPPLGCVGVQWVGNCYHAAAFLNPFNLKCNKTMFCKMLNSDLLTQGRGEGGGGGGLGANICYRVAA